MQKDLAGLEWKKCFVYLDDILLASKTFEEHLSYLREVFLRFHVAGLRLKPKKYGFLKETVKFLGHVISRAGIRPDPAKTENVRSYPHTVDATRLHRFLGLASYLQDICSCTCHYCYSVAFFDQKECCVPVVI